MEATNMPDTAAAGAAVATTQPAQPITIPSINTGTAPAQMPDSKFESGGVVDTLKNLNWIQIGFGVLGSYFLFLGIYYFRYNIKMTKTFVGNVENKIDELDIKYADLSSVVNKGEKQKEASNKGFI
jgi:hypothetical protein